jgi:hypothetical protein
MKLRLLLLLAVVGFVAPNVLLGIYIADEGWDPGGYFSLWFDSTPSTQLVIDLTIASWALFVWAWLDGPRSGVRRWWLCIPATLLVGLCFGLPLYLYMRERAIEAKA